MCKNKTFCSCGCSKSVILKENKIAMTSISKGLQYHINTGKPLHETIYRKNTKTYNKLFQEARKLYSRNLLEIKDPTDLKLIKDKNYGYLKENKSKEELHKEIEKYYGRKLTSSQINVLNGKDDKISNLLSKYRKINREKNLSELKLIKDKNYGYLKEGKVGEYTVVWTDRDYKEHKKVFKDDPKGSPENGLKKAKEFKKKLEDKDKKDKYGLYRSITLKENKNYVLDIEGNKVKDISKDGDSCSNRIRRRGTMDDEFGDLPPAPKGVQEDWDPNGWESEYLIDQKDLKDESIIKEFIELNGLDPLVLDIWKYGKSNLGAYPLKITNRGMLYSSNRVEGYIEIEFTKPNFTIHRTTLSAGKSRGQIDYHFKGNGEFSFKNFKNFMEIGKIQESKLIKTQVEYKGKKYWVEYSKDDKKVFAYLDKDLRKTAKVNGKTLMFTLKDIEDKLIKEDMKLQKLKKLIREVYLKEDVYYPPQPQPNNDIENIEEIVSEVLDEYIGLDSASFMIRDNGKRIELYSNKEAREAFEEKDDSFKEMLLQGWEETCNEIIDRLDRAGFPNYYIGNATFASAFIVRQ